MLAHAALRRRRAAARAAGRRPAQGAGDRRRVRRLGDGLGLPRARPAGDPRRGGPGAAGRRTGRRRSAASPRGCSATTGSTCAAGARSASLEDDGGRRAPGRAVRRRPRSRPTSPSSRSAAMRNVEWLDGSGLAVGPRGVACDAGCRAFDANGVITDDVFVAGDVARFPHPLYGYQLIALEHWDNAVAQAEVAAHNMVCAGPSGARTCRCPPSGRRSSASTSSRSGSRSFSDSLMVTQGSWRSAGSSPPSATAAGSPLRSRSTRASGSTSTRERIRRGCGVPAPVRGVAPRRARHRTFPAEFPDPYTPSHEPDRAADRAPAERAPRPAARPRPSRRGDRGRFHRLPAGPRPGRPCRPVPAVRPAPGAAGVARARRLVRRHPLPRRSPRCCTTPG